MNVEVPAEMVADALARLRGRGGHRGVGADSSRAARASRDAGGAHGSGGGPALRRLVARLASTGAPLSVSDISIEVGVDQPRASRLVAQGVEMGLLRREADPDDARRTHIVLTEQGRRHAAHLHERHRRAAAAALEGFTEAEQQQFAMLFTRFADAWQNHHRS